MLGCGKVRREKVFFFFPLFHVRGLKFTAFCSVTMFSQLPIDMKEKFFAPSGREELDGLLEASKDAEVGGGSKILHRRCYPLSELAGKFVRRQELAAGPAEHHLFIALSCKASINVNLIYL